MRVQLISTYYAPETTGNAPYATGLAEGLAARGHDVSVVAAAPHYPGWKILPSTAWQRAEQREGVAVQRVTSYVPRRPSFLRRVAYELLFGLKYAARVDTAADVIVMLSPSLFASAVVRTRLAWRRERPRTVLWMQDLYSAGVKEGKGSSVGLLSTCMTAVEGAIARSFDRVVVIHQRFRGYVTETLKVPTERVEVIRNWTHVRPEEPADREDVRRDLGWGRTDETVVVHAGNMGAKQGLENVVDAARLADDRDLPIRFVLLGDGNQRSRLVARAAGIDRVTFMDPLPDPTFWRPLSRADVLLVNERPGVNEAAVPSKLTTYFATGRPVLAATEAASTTADELRASQAGRIVPAGDPSALLDAAVGLPSQWSETDSAAGPNYVDTVLSERVAIRRFDDLFASMTAAAAQNPGA